MFNKNLKYYRLKKNMTKKALASVVGVTPMAITNYENGKRRPDMPTLKALANTLDVRITDFLDSRNSNLVFTHEEFRKTSKLTFNQQEYVKESAEEYFGRFFDVVEMLGGEVLPVALKSEELTFSDDCEICASELRKYLGLAKSGPVGNLIEILENNGVLVYLLDIDNDGFSGRNGTVNGRPYIIANSNMTAERIRTTIVHELAHFAFKWPELMDDKSIEKAATAIAGAFLLPRADLVRELGLKRSAITNDMGIVCREYGVAMSMLAVRTHECGIISQTAYRRFFMSLNNAGGRKKEVSRIDKEKTTLFEQLVYRAVNESEISIQKGAELLKVPYSIVERYCCPAEV